MDKKLDRLAKENAPMPVGLPSYQQCYYIASRGLYQQYAKSEISLQQARIEKKEIIKAYKEGEAEWQYFLKLHEVLDKLKALKEEGFDSVLEFEILELIEGLLH